MGCYGRENAYFESGDKRFRNCVWIELIGFDNTAEDYGVGRFLDAAGFVPHAVSFHLSSIDFVNTHPGMEQELPLPLYSCSYGAHTHNDDRERQDWTNWQMKGLVDALHSRGVKVFSSFFDLEYQSGRAHLPTKFTDAYPELLCVDRDGETHPFLYMLKRFADGTPYLDYLLPRLLKVVNDYGLDGIQIADGLSSPRLSLEHAEFSDDIVGRFVAQTGLLLPDTLSERCDGNKDAIRARAEWVCREHRAEWIRWMTGEWRTFVTTLIRALRKNGIFAGFNSAWTKDPTESLYRYGADYVAYERAGATNFVVEDVSADLAILGNDGQGNNITMERRRYVHYEFAANLMCNKAAMPSLKMTPLSMIRDTLEQWDVLHHMPTAMQRAAATNLNLYLVTPEGFTPVTNGPWFCLGDGLDSHEWRDVRMTWDNGYTPVVRDVAGYTAIWSNDRSLREVDAMVSERGWITAKWLGELMANGAPIHKIAPIEWLDFVTGPILVSNPALLSDKERARIAAYKRGTVAYIGALTEGVAENECLYVSKCSWKTVAFWTGAGRADKTLVFEAAGTRPDDLNALPELLESWRHPMRYHPVGEGFLAACARWVETDCDHPKLTLGCEQYMSSENGTNVTAENDGTCHVMQVMMTENRDRFLIENEAYYYIMPVLHLKRPIKRVEFLTKPVGYPAPITETTVSTSVPGRGMDIFEVVYR